MHKLDFKNKNYLEDNPFSTLGINIIITTAIHLIGGGSLFKVR